MATQSTHVSSHSASHEYSPLDRKEDLRTRARGRHGGPGRERGYLEHTLEYHSSSSSSSRKLIRKQTEITAMTTTDFKELAWRSTSSLRSRAYQITNAKTYVFSDSVLCLGKMRDDPSAVGKNKIKWYSENNHLKDMNRIDGMPTEFDWTIFPGITRLGLLEKIQSLMKSIQCA